MLPWVAKRSKARPTEDHYRIGVKVIHPGMMLVSHPSQHTEPFRESVVIISEHHQGGTVGFITNKNTHVQFQKVMQERGQTWPFPDELYMGGPVNTTALITLHSPEWYSSNTFQINQDFAISSDSLMTEKIGMGNTPLHYRFITGMSGWSPGQLEREIKQKRWLTVTARPDLIFETSGQTQWRKAIDICATQATAQFF